MSTPKIRDNYSLQEFQYQLDNIKTLEDIYKAFSALGVKNKGLETAFKNMENIYDEFKKFRETPDEFNKLFADRGWIAYESMNFSVMVEAVELAQSGKLQDAEQLLVEYYNEKNLRFLVNRLNGIQECRPRINLINLAVTDYLEERYYACIPLILMMMDGFVNDIESKGFFASDTDLSIWDTIAAHSSGLNSLLAILGKPRKRTTSEVITIPYRHGILHGRDLGYANKTVAAKVWAALFALVDWARAVKTGKRELNQVEFSPPTVKESIQSIKESIDLHHKNQMEKKLIDRWEPRQLRVGIDVPERGDGSEYVEGSPEKALIEFLEYVTKNNYGKVAELTTLFSPNEKISQRAGIIREIFKGKQLTDYHLKSVFDKAPAITEIDVCLIFEVMERETLVDKTFRLIFQDENCTPLVRGASKGSWYILFNFYDLEYIN